MLGKGEGGGVGRGGAVSGRRRVGEAEEAGRPRSAL